MAYLDTQAATTAHPGSDDAQQPERVLCHTLTNGAATVRILAMPGSATIAAQAGAALKAEVETERVAWYPADWLVPCSS